jgi:hypothetical protein
MSRLEKLFDVCNWRQPADSLTAGNRAMSDTSSGRTYRVNLTLLYISNPIRSAIVPNWRPVIGAEPEMHA